MYREAQKHNIRKVKNKRYDVSFGKKLNRIYAYKLKLYKILIKKVFKIKPSKKINKICLFFFNRKRRRRNFD